MAEKRKKYPWNKSILNLFWKRINRLENVGGVYAGPPPEDNDEPALTVYDGPPAGIQDRFQNRFSQLKNTGRVYAGPPPREDDDDEPALSVYDGPPVEPGPGQEFPVFPEEEPVIDVYNGPPVDLFEEPEVSEEPEEEPEEPEKSEEPEAPEDPEDPEALYEADPLGVYNGPAVPSDDKGIFSWNRGPLAPWEIAAPVYAGPEMMQERSSAIPPVPAPEVYTPETSDSEAPAPNLSEENGSDTTADGSVFRGETGEAEKAQEAGGRTENAEPMIKCPGCGFEYPVSSRFCPECGTPNPGKR
ncbi:MAG: zinc ribbon domain-containing protein [Lachnospiraceae bacterium]|nr:zinc ribbon domain-containing protein [Lachnospiraceae bacterium]